MAQLILDLQTDYFFAPLSNRSTFDHARQHVHFVFFHSDFVEYLIQCHAVSAALVIVAKSKGHRAPFTHLAHRPGYLRSILNFRQQKVRHLDPIKLTLHILNLAQKLLKVHFSDASYSLSISILAICI